MSHDRVRTASLLDQEIRRHYVHFRAATRIGTHDRVLDIGCGAGESTRDAARAARSGSVLGVDVADDVVEHARRVTEQTGLGNVTYLVADAQTHAFAPASYDVCISRFGTMFFADPAAAFAGIATALRPGGRLVLLTWQARDRNEWAREVPAALAPASGPTPDPPGGTNPFSLGDPALVESLLTGAGFADVEHTDVDEPVCYGPDVASATSFVLGLLEPQRLIGDLDRATREAAVERLRVLLAEHLTDEGVLLGSRAWVVTAHRH